MIDKKEFNGVRLKASFQFGVTYDWRFMIKEELKRNGFFDISFGPHNQNIIACYIKEAEASDNKIMDVLFERLVMKIKVNSQAVV